MLKLNEDALDWALKHALAFGDTDIFPEAFEFAAINDQWPTVKASLLETNVLDWNVRPSRRCMVPKHRFGFRVSTQLDPLDFLIYTALVRDVGATLEAERIPAAQNVVHSYRFAPNTDGHMFSDQYTYRSFQKTSHDVCTATNPSHIVIADVADFFPRLYTHRVDNALDRALGIGHSHAKALKDLISHWAGAYSYGIPVGSAASRLIAEVTIADVDQLLLSEGLKYLRFSDDFRFFCTSEADAYRTLTLVAKYLFENHGLTLQQHKTKIVSVDEFRAVYLRENDKRELDTLSERFYELLEEIGIEDLYDDVDVDSLDADQQNAIASLNLEGILEEQLATSEPDLSLLRFVLRRLGQLSSDAGVDLVFENFEKFVPVIRQAIEYLLKLNTLSPSQKKALGEQVLEIYQDPESTAPLLEYSRMYLLRPFAVAKDWNSEDEYVRLFNDAVDEFSRRELLLAMGRSKKDFWFRSRKQSLGEMAPWLRRAFIYGASCLPADEYKHWIRGIDGQLDPLERAVAAWARKFPIIQ